MVRELRAAGHGVTVVDLAPAEAGIPYVKGDVMDLPSLEAAFKGHDAVIHLAALDLAIQTTQDHFMRVNVLGTWNVLQAAEAAGMRKAVAPHSSPRTNISPTRAAAVYWQIVANASTGFTPCMYLRTLRP